MRPIQVLCAATAAALSGCGPDSAPPGAPGDRPAPDLVDEARERGLDYLNRSGGAAKEVILEANGAGVAWIDLGNDGDLDLVFAQGLDSLERITAGPGADLEVFLNDGRGRFTRAPGPGLSGWWTGLATGDVDGDGDADLVAAGFGELALCLQDAQGRLFPHPGSGLLAADAPGRLVIGRARAAGAPPPAWATSVALFDADRDGALDLYVGQYLELDPVDPPRKALGAGALAIPCRWKGHAVFCGPAGLTPQRDRFLRGRGDGSFVDATAAAFPELSAGYALGVLPFDADQDGDTDVFVANDSSPNFLWINDGRGVFAERAFAAGVAYSAEGRAQAGMGAAAGDVDGDGQFDFAVTNFTDEPTELYLSGGGAGGARGTGRGFARGTHRYGLLRATRRLLSWGVHLVDLDADGALDLVQTNGHVFPEADQPDTGTRYRQPVTAWHLTSDGACRAFEPRDARSLFAMELGARGSALGDCDGDGAPDLAVAALDGPARLGINRLAPAGQRLALRCLGPRAPARDAPRTPADGHGARVIVVLGEGAAQRGLIAEVQTAAGYQSASSPWLHFGLGAHARYEALRVLWPSGRVEVLPGGAAGRALVLREGEGVVETREFAR